jgi:AraC-like DNA-binding protein
MPSSAVRCFTDPDQYAGAVRAAAAQMTAVGGGSFVAKLTRIDLHALWMQHFQETLPFVSRTAIFPGRAIIVFGTGEAPAPVEGGVELDAETLYRFAEAQSSFQHASGPTAFAAMSLPIDQLAVAGTALVGAELRPPADGTGLRPPPSALGRLRQLHAAAARLAEEQPEIIANPSAAMALEQELIQAMIACFAEGEARGDSSASRHHTRIMRRFHELIEESTDERLHIVELCTHLNVSDRTLRACCQEHLGMSPHRYLWLRQMTIARRALLRAEPGSTTVTDIATANGFWELGRFAVGYRQLFGEPPSASLRRPPQS